MNDVNDQRKGAEGTMIQNRVVLPLVFSVLSLLLTVSFVPGLLSQDDPFGSGRAVEPGYLGVRLGVLSEGLSKELGVEVGVLITDVMKDSPADLAGLKVRDVLIVVAGDKVSERSAVVKRVRTRSPGDLLKLEVQRGTERLSFEVTLGRAGEPPRVLEPRSEGKPGFLGVGFAEVPVVLAVHLELADGVGVLVGDARRGSAAEKAGIVTHDVIVKIDGEWVKGGRGLVDLISGRSPGDEVTLEVIHRGKPVTKKVVLGERPRALPSPRLRPEGRPWRLPSPLWPRGPWRGRFRIGDDFSYEIPWGDWQFDELPDLFKDGFKSGLLDDDVRKHLEEAFKDFESTFSGTHSKVRLIEGGFDITVTGDDGQIRLTVKKDGEVIAEDLPYEKLDTLPEDVQKLVRKLMEEHKIEFEWTEPRLGPPLKLKADDLGGESVEI